MFVFQQIIPIQSDKNDNNEGSSEPIMVTWTIAKSSLSNCKGIVIEGSNEVIGASEIYTRNKRYLIEKVSTKPRLILFWPGGLLTGALLWLRNKCYHCVCKSAIPTANHRDKRMTCLFSCNLGSESIGETRSKGNQSDCSNGIFDTHHTTEDWCNVSCNERLSFLCFCCWFFLGNGMND